MEASVSQSQPQSSGAGVLSKFDSLDKWLSLKMHQAGAVVPRWSLRALEHSGDGRFSIPIPAAVWLAPVLFEFQELRCFLLNLYAAFMFDLVFVGVVKSIIRRPRPVYNKGMYVFVATDHWSFPSGHASRALLIATLFWSYESLLRSLMYENVIPSLKPYLDQMYPGSGMLLLASKPLIVPALLYLLTAWAVATAASRILLGRHYFVDVAVGSALGAAEAYVLHHYFSVPVETSQALHRSFLAKLGVASVI